jgi:exportin-T
LDFPQDWPGFFSDLAAATLTTPSGLTASKDNPMNLEDISTMPSPDGVRLWLTILHVIHEEVVSSDVNRSATDAAHASILKDAMRDISNVDIVETWYNLLVCFHENHRDTVNSTLQVMVPYIDWIDIGLIINDRFLPILFKLATMPDYAAKAMEVFIALLDKGMDRDPRAKLELMQTLQLPRILSQLQAGDDETMEMAALLVNSMGVEILDCYKIIGDSIATDSDLNKLAGELLHCALENLFKYFNDDVDDTSRAVVNFAKQYLQFMRKIRKMNGGVFGADMLEQLRILIQIYHKKMRYDESYDFDDMDGEEDEFEEFRRTLGDQFRSVTKMEPELVFEYVGSLISNISVMNDPLDMEVSLRCMWLMGEGLIDSNSATGPAPFFIDLFRTLLDSKIFTYEEPRVLVSQFFECVTRYSKLFANVPDLMTPLLTLWMGKHGVLHPHPPTRAHRCIGFTQFVKNLKAPLQGYLMDIVSHLQDFATLKPDSFAHISLDEQLELLESFGVLVGFDRFDNAKHKQYLDLLVLPLVENLAQIIEQKLYLNDQPHNQYHTNWVNCLIRGIGSFSKGFPLPIVTVNGIRRPDTSAVATEAMNFFARVFDIVMQTLGLLGNNRT